MRHESTKTYPHSLGLSACFRQWRASSHCNLLHGYALAFKFTFGADELDERRWVMDFGDLKPLKELLVQTFDHKLIVANDDPEFEYFHAMSQRKNKVADVIAMNHVGCEAFAEMAYWMAFDVTRDYNEKEERRQLAKVLIPVKNRVKVLSCECSEHEANSAIFKPEAKYEL